MAGLNQVNAPGPEVRNPVCLEDQIQEVAQGKRLSGTTIDTCIKNIIVPILTTEEGRFGDAVPLAKAG